MSEIGHNGSSEGASILPPDPHDEFVELCALSTTGELTAEESARLQVHLAQCAACRKAQQDFENFVALTIPALAEEEGASLGNGHIHDSWSIEGAESRLFESLRDEPGPLAVTPISQDGRSTLKVISRYAAAAVLLASVGIGSYRLGTSHRAQPASIAVATPASSPRVPARSGLVQGEAGSQNPKPPAELAGVTSLRSQLGEEQLESSRLKESLSQLQAELAATKVDADRSSKDRVDLEKRIALLQSNAEGLQAKLDQVSAQEPKEEAAPSPSLKAQILDLNAALQEKNKEVSEDQDLLQHDRDIRNLIGARNLYIAEIYDIAKNGNTQKPFGRVFYTKDKSLIFYGYDLDQQKGVKQASVFQAWGRRGSDRQHDVSLGLFYQDDAVQKRWVLKSNDAKTIGQLDAVFVTVEPAGGSSKPSSKPLLFTYLRLDPNHP